MAIIYQTNKKTGITYVIESESYWDKDKQQPRSHRTIIGKIDPDTGEVVPTKKYNREKKSSSPSKSRASVSQSSSVNSAATVDQTVDQTDRIAELEGLIAQLRKEKEDLIRDLSSVLQQYTG